jgi:hypothetical protein
VVSNQSLAVFQTVQLHDTTSRAKDDKLAALAAAKKFCCPKLAE